MISRLKHAGLQLAGGRTLLGAWSEAWGRNAIRELLHRAPDVDAIFAGSDQIARGVIDALDRDGISVPEQVSVVGLTTGRRWPLRHPPLTTVDMNLQHLGWLAAGRLFEAMAGRTVSGVESLPCRLVTRESTASAA